MKNNNKVSLLRRRKTAMDWIKKYLVLIIGSLIYSAGLEIFLVPNNIIDGGIVGISIMASYLTGIPFGVYMLVLNLPFLYLGYKQIGKTFAISTIISIIALSIFSEFLEPVPQITQDYFLAAIFGGIIAGAGVGLVIRQGGSLDYSHYPRPQNFLLRRRGCYVLQPIYLRCCRLRFWLGQGHVFLGNLFYHFQND